MASEGAGKPARGRPSAFLRSETTWTVAADLLPLFGVFFLSWDIGTPVLLYCLEAILLTPFFAARIVANRDGRVVEKLIFTPFFCAWYLVLTLGELAFALVTFHTPGHDGPTFLAASPMELLELAGIAAVRIGIVPLAIEAVLILRAHALDFSEYLRRGGLGEDIEWLVYKPFGRVAGIVLLLVPGGMFLYFRGNAWYFAVALTAFKLATDLYRLKRADRRFAGAAGR